jgi:hypothetical protein
MGEPVRRTSNPPRNRLYAGTATPVAVFATRIALGI